MLVKILCSIVIATGLLGVLLFLTSLPNPTSRDTTWLFASLIWLGGGIYVLIGALKKERQQGK